jgi:hypothetical protein
MMYAGAFAIGALVGLAGAALLAAAGFRLYRRTQTRRPS